MTNTCYRCNKLLEDSLQVKHGLHPSCFEEWFNLVDAEEEFRHLSFERDAQEGKQAYINTSFFHGKFKKYSADLGGKKYILKMSQEYPELPRMEYLCNQIGALVGLDIPKHYMLHFQGEQDCFVTYNFMQDFPPATLEHGWRFLKESDKYNLEILLGVVEKYTGRFTEIQKFIQMCLFDALTGNHDRHGRNFGLIRTSQGYQFSPCYDNPSYFGIAEFLGAHHSPRCVITTYSTEEPMMKDYIEEFVRLGFKEEIMSFRKRVDIEKIRVLVGQSFVSKARQSAFLRFMEGTYQELCNVL